MIATNTLISPYGGKLIDLLVPHQEREELKAHASTLASIQISDRAACDLEMLAIGAFSPLDRFMGQADHQAVLDTMRLTNGALFPIPVTLPVSAGPEIALDTDIALRNDKNELLAVMTIEEIYPWDLQRGGPEGLWHAGSAPSAGGRDASLGQAQYLRPAARAEPA